MCLCALQQWCKGLLIGSVAKKGLSSPWKLTPIQPMEWEGCPAHETEGYPAYEKWRQSSPSTNGGCPAHEGFPAHDKNWGLSSPWKLGAIQPMKTEGYPAHENWGLSSPWKLGAIQPMNTEGYPAHEKQFFSFFFLCLFFFCEADVAFHVEVKQQPKFLQHFVCHHVSRCSSSAGSSHLLCNCHEAFWPIAPCSLWV